MNRPVVVVVCNALDDQTRLTRCIDSDSPAASRKVFKMCMALRLAGVRPYVLSLGRGRANGSRDNWSAKVCRIDGVITIYAPFSHWPIWSELLSFFGLMNPLLRMARYQSRAVIFYNRMPAYLPILFESTLLNFRRFLDLEDGEVIRTNFFSELFSRALAFVYDRMCSGGALLACRELERLTQIRPVHCYYGTSNEEFKKKDWPTVGFKCLMAGTLIPDSGALLLAEAIKRLRTCQPKWVDGIVFEITGKGESLHDFEMLAADTRFPHVRVHGRLTDAEYKEVLHSCDVGLSLKKVGGALANTTFPSKVVEFAESGLLVLSTDISDVRVLFSDAAWYLEDDDPELLVGRLAEIAKNRVSAKDCAERGRRLVTKHCAPINAGNELKKFIFNAV